MIFPLSRLGRAVPFTVILIAAFLATLPFLMYGPSCGHDLTFHLLNWMDAAHQWQHGTLRPWWCFPAAWNTGEPRFLFYPPLSWNLGALLTLGLGVSRAPVAYTFLALTASGITMRRFLGAHVPHPLALLGACLYLAHPYMLFTAMERTAYAELLAAAWLPWLLQDLLSDSIHVNRLAIPVALLWLTNTPAAVLGTYTIAIVIVIRIIFSLKYGQPATRPLIIPTLTGYLLGLALAAFYLLPAVVQHNAVEVTQAFTEGMRPEDGTLFHRTGLALHDQVVHQASWLAVIFWGTALIAVFTRFLQRTSVSGMVNRAPFATEQETFPCYNRGPKTENLYAVLLVLTALMAFLLTPVSLFVWHHAPELQFLQFPWRTLMLQGVVTVTLIVLAIRARLKLCWTIPLALATVTVASFAAHHAYAQVCDNEDAPYSLVAQYNHGQGFEPYDEYTPKNADNDLLHPGEPPAWTAASATSAAVSARLQTRGGNITIESSQASTRTYQVQPAPGDRFVILRQRRFRNWQISLDGTPVVTEPLRDDDLLAIPLPDTAHHTITLAYRWSADEVGGVVLSIAAAIVCLLFNYNKRTRRIA